MEFGEKLHWTHSKEAGFSFPDVNSAVEGQLKEKGNTDITAGIAETIFRIEKRMPAITGGCKSACNMLTGRQKSVSVVVA